jgi:hypothetical protein
MRRTRLALVASAIACAPAVCHAAVLYSEDFESVDTAANNWALNRQTPFNAGEVGFDYSTVGIPAAPHSAGGTTRGLKLEADIPTNNTFTGVSASPLDQHFPDNYTLRADVWQNFNGPFPGGGSGSTQMTWAGIGTNGTTPQFPGTSVQGVGFAASGDGGTTQDYRAYTNTGAPLLPSSGAYAAGTTDSPAASDSRQASDPYYVTHGFGSRTAPPAQLELFSQQTGATAPGTQGMAWHTWEITRIDNTVTWTIDGVLISTVDVTNEPFFGDNFFLGQFDINASSSADPNARSLLFGLFDNVQVTDAASVPEPGTMGLIVTAAAGLLARYRKSE